MISRGVLTQRQGAVLLRRTAGSGNGRTRSWRRDGNTVDGGSIAGGTRGTLPRRHRESRTRRQCGRAPRSYRRWRPLRRSRRGLCTRRSAHERGSLRGGRQSRLPMHKPRANAAPPTATVMATVLISGLRGAFERTRRPNASRTATGDRAFRARHPARLAAAESIRYVVRQQALDHVRHARHGSSNPRRFCSLRHGSAPAFDQVGSRPSARCVRTGGGRLRVKGPPTPANQAKQDEEERTAEHARKVDTRTVGT